MLGSVAVSLWGVSMTKYGVEYTDSVPRGSNEYKWLALSAKYFTYFDFYLITKEADYANRQLQLYEYQQAFKAITPVVKDNDGEISDFWLGHFRNWLWDLQRRFDSDWNAGYINKNGWSHRASDDGSLAYKLLVQTGNESSTINVSRVLDARLVDDDGVINPSGFYNYLSAWAGNDIVLYAASQAEFRPKPVEWVHDTDDHSLSVPKSKQIIYAQIPLYLHNLPTTQSIIDCIINVREICDRFSASGLPNFPRGVLFTFYEQYINLKMFLVMALAAVLGTLFIVMSLFLSPRISCIVSLILVINILELYGFMGFIGVQISGIPFFILIISVGIGIEFTVHIALAYLTHCGDRNERMANSVEYMFAPVIHGAISTLLGVVMLAFSEFDFIIKNFFYTLTALVMIGLLNGILILPVLLSLLGPRSASSSIAEHADLNHNERLDGFELNGRGACVKGISYVSTSDRIGDKLTRHAATCYSCVALDEKEDAGAVPTRNEIITEKS